MKTSAYIDAKISWLVQGRPTDDKFATTAFRTDKGIDDLFSVYVKFFDEIKETARIYTLVKEMENRLPSLGNKLTITAGHKPIANCLVVGQGMETLD
jgi:hypothetical protein